MTTDLQAQLQALIGPEEEWPDEVREYMHARYVMLSQRREARDAIDVTFNARIEAAIAVPDAALLAVARMVKRGTLDGLRAAMQADIDATPHNSSDCVENIWYVEGVKDAMRRLDQFGAHPTKEPLP